MTDRERFNAATQADQPKARLISAHAIDGAVVVHLADSEGFIHMLRVKTADAPELATLPAADRSRIASMVIALHQQPGPNAAA